MDNNPVNPWLGQLILEYRRNHPDDELRRGYRDYIRGGSTKYSWADYVGRTALNDYASENPVFLMPRSEMPLPEHTRDILNYHYILCLADLMQMTIDELDLVFTDKQELQLVISFLADNNLHLCSWPEYTYKLCIESIDRERENFDEILNRKLESIKQAFPVSDLGKLTRTQYYKEAIHLYEEAARYAQRHDCCVTVCKELYYSYCSIMETGIIRFHLSIEYAGHVFDRLIYYSQICDATPLELAVSYGEYGDLFYLKGLNTRALEKYKTALDLVIDEPQETDRDDAISRFYSMMGSCYRGLKYYDNAIESFNKALEYLDDLSFLDDWAQHRKNRMESAYSSLADIYEEIGNQEKADYYHNLAGDNDPDHNSDSPF
ncbi:MAG: hypothetical protein J6T18_10820 [Bacteroidaceae bacterium]|nr:hypothetical protein [Bacteroidaceae bacterium]